MTGDPMITLVCAYIESYECMYWALNVRLCVRCIYSVLYA